MRIHPAAEIFPMMVDPEIADLAADIKAHGLQQPIVVLTARTYSEHEQLVDGKWVRAGGPERIAEGEVLDGRNRLRACELAGVEPRFVEADEAARKDPVGFVVSMNMHRRHLDAGQRAMIAARLATLPLGSNQHREDTARAVPTQQQAAAMLDVSVDGLQRARTVLDTGAPELVAAVQAGDVSVKAAAAVAALPVDQQKQIVAGGPKAVAAASKAAQKRGQGDEFARQNIPVDLHPLWERTKRQFKGDPHARVQAFMQYAHEHQGDAVQAMQGDADAKVKALIRAVPATGAAAERVLIPVEQWPELLRQCPAFNTLQRKVAKLEKLLADDLKARATVRDPAVLDAIDPEHRYRAVLDAKYKAKRYGLPVLDAIAEVIEGVKAAGGNK